MINTICVNCRIVIKIFYLNVCLVCCILFYSSFFSYYYFIVFVFCLLFLLRASRSKPEFPSQKIQLTQIPKPKPKITIPNRRLGGPLAYQNSLHVPSSLHWHEHRPVPSPCGYCTNHSAITSATLQTLYPYLTSSPINYQKL